MGRDLRSLALIGGFGRGEGGIRLVDGEYRVVNDVDLIVVPRGLGFLAWRRHAPALSALAERLAAELGIKQIDIGFRTVRMLKRPRLTVADYEIAAGHIVLSGPPLPVNPCCFDDGRAIPLTEGTVYFLNRGSGLLLARRYISRSGTIQQRDVENFGIELDKALLAMGDALLIERGRYTARYQERAERVAGLDLGSLEDGPWIQAQYLESVQRKLFPEGGSTEDPVRRWEAVQAVFLKFFLGYERRRMGRSLEHWREYGHLIGRHFRVGRGRELVQTLRHLLGSGGTRDLMRPAWWREAARRQHRRLLQVMPLLLSAASPTLSAARVERLEQAERLLGLPHAGEPDDRWDKAVNRYLLLYHPGGAAEEVARRPVAGPVPGGVIS